MLLGLAARSLRHGSLPTSGGRRLLGTAAGLYAVNRLYVPRSILAARHGALRTAWYEATVMARNCPAKIDILGLWIRKPGEDTCAAIDGTSMAPIDDPHPSPFGALTNYATSIAKYDSPAHMQHAIEIALRDQRISDALGKAPLVDDAVRVERVPMVRVPVAMPSPTVELHSAKVYEVRAYTLKGYSPFSAATGAPTDGKGEAYVRWIEEKFRPVFDAEGGRIACFLMQCDVPAQVSSCRSAASGSLDQTSINLDDQPPHVVWVAEWDSREQADAVYANLMSRPGAFEGNPFATPEGTLSGYARVEVTWSEGLTLGTLIESSTVGSTYEDRHFHQPRQH